MHPRSASGSERDGGPRPPRTPYVGRLAPSPTGRVHQGTARSFLAAWLDARAHGGLLLFRNEDVDQARTIAGASDQIKRDLEWLGLDWDREVPPQSERTERYAEAIRGLEGRVFPCTCTRKEVMQAPGAPRYPGTCRDGKPRNDRPASLRLRTHAGERARVRDRIAGDYEEDVHAEVGDFVLRRSDGVWAYQLAVTVDDLDQGVTSVVRGSDLASSAGRQALLRKLIAPTSVPVDILHVPLFLHRPGVKLSKRDGATPVTELGDPKLLIGALARSLGIEASDAAMPSDLLPAWGKAKLPTADSVLPA